MQCSLNDINLPGLICKQVAEPGSKCSEKDAHYIDQDNHLLVGLVRFYAHPTNQNSIFAAYLASERLVLVELNPDCAANGVNPTTSYELTVIQQFVKEGAHTPDKIVLVPSECHGEALWFLPEEKAV